MLIYNILSWFKGNFKVIAVIIISIFAAIIVFQRNQIQKKNKEVDRLWNNLEYYQEQKDSLIDNTRTLRLTINEFKNSKDSTIQELNKVKKELKIKDKELQQAQSQKQQIVIDTTIVVEDNFKEEIKPNNLTSIIIAKQDSILTAKVDIRNTQTLFISSKREYKNKYKNFFCRLFKFDFKKVNVYRYQIHNTNDLIKVTDTKLIEITQ